MERYELLLDGATIKLVRTSDRQVVFASPLATTSAYFINDVALHLSGSDGFYRLLLKQLDVVFRNPNPGSMTRTLISDRLTMIDMNVSVFGGSPDTNYSIENTTTVLDNAGRIYVVLTNVGSQAATVTVGTAQYVIDAGGVWDYEAKKDAGSTLLTPLPTMTIVATSTKININQRWAQ